MATQLIADVQSLSSRHLVSKVHIGVAIICLSLCWRMARYPILGTEGTELQYDGCISRNSTVCRTGLESGKSFAVCRFHVLYGIGRAGFYFRVPVISNAFTIARALSVKVNVKGAIVINV